MSDATHDEIFIELRPRLFGIAYRMLGSVADAEDVLQDAWVRWRARTRAEVVNDGAYLTRVVTNLSIDTLRRLKTVRDQYPGPWLPEPIVSDIDEVGDGEAMTDLAKSLSVALLALLETLPPNERATFVLREAFDLSFDEIANCLSAKPATCRQWSTRARRRLSDLDWRDSSPAIGRDLLERFVEGLSAGDHAAVLSLLDEDIVLMSDGGGKVAAATKPIRGVRAVSRFLLGLGERSAGRLSSSLARVNNEWGGIVSLDSTVDSVFSIRVSGDRITGIYILRNPDKLKMLEPISTL